MPHIRSMVEFNRVSQLAEDKIVNTFHFRVPVASDAALDIIETRINNFYELVPPGATVDVRNDMGGALLHTTGHTIKHYNMDLLPPRPPLRVDPLDYVPNAASSLPAEVALCLSFRAALVAGLNPKRRRGRIYVGPYAIGSAATTGPDSRPASGVTDRLARAGKALMDASSSTTAEWMVYSEVSNSLALVEHVWVDNAWDTQRRRGAAPSARSSFDRAAT